MAQDLPVSLRDALQTGHFEQVGLAIDGALQDQDISVKLEAVRSLHDATAEATERSVP
jgi:hypothetical protein